MTTPLSELLPRPVLVTLDELTLFCSDTHFWGDFEGQPLAVYEGVTAVSARAVMSGKEVAGLRGLILPGSDLELFQGERSLLVMEGTPFNLEEGCHIDEAHYGLNTPQSYPASFGQALQLWRSLEASRLHTADAQHAAAVRATK